MPNIIIHGNPVDGLQFIGPFPDGEEINEYHTEPLDEWWIASLESPFSGPLGSQRRYVAPDGEHIDAANPLNRRSVIEIHLKELARYLGVEFPGEMSEGITIADLTNHIIAGFFPEQEN